MSCSPEPGQPRELRVERPVAAPVETVWRVMTERLPEWFCPRPWRTEVVALEWKAGGRFATVLRGPEGEANAGDGLMLEVSPNRRFVFTDAMTHDFVPQGPFMIGAFELSPQGESTLLSGWARHWTEEAMQQHREMGFIDGWAMVLNQIAELSENG
jgi:uncharacterized protein YndB with AHSA1/START domain